MSWYFEVLSKYAVFSGRARRKEYWMFSLFNTIIGIALIFTERAWGSSGALYGLYFFAVLIPAIAVSVRRMHDSDHSGWWILFPIVNFVFLFLDSHPGDNRFGPNPKGVTLDTSITHSNGIQPRLVATTNTQGINSVSDNYEEHVAEIDEDGIYGQIAEELDGGNLNKATWTKAYAASDGDEKRTRSLYINLRFKQLGDEWEKAQKTLEIMPVASPVSEEVDNELSLVEHIVAIDSEPTTQTSLTKPAIVLLFIPLIIVVFSIFDMKVGLTDGKNKTSQNSVSTNSITSAPSPAEVPVPQSLTPPPENSVLDPVAAPAAPTTPDKDYKQASKLKIKAAYPDDGSGEYSLGQRFLQGDGGVIQDYSEAADQFRKAALKGNAKAQFKLGYLFSKGQGVMQDYALSAKWLTKAADQGLLEAQLSIAEMYALGVGVDKDDQKAAKWYKKAAEQGDESAQRDIGELYEKGQGITQDNRRAYMWYGFAAAKNEFYAEELRNHLAGKMTQDQIAEAEQLAEACEKRNYKNCD